MGSAPNSGPLMVSPSSEPTSRSARKLGGGRFSWRVTRCAEKADVSGRLSGSGARNALSTAHPVADVFALRHSNTPSTRRPCPFHYAPPALPPLDAAHRARRHRGPALTRSPGAPIADASRCFVPAARSGASGALSVAATAATGSAPPSAMLVAMTTPGAPGAGGCEPLDRARDAPPAPASPPPRCTTAPRATRRGPS